MIIAGMKDRDTIKGSDGVFLCNLERTLHTVKSIITILYPFKFCYYIPIWQVKFSVLL